MDGSAFTPRVSCWGVSTRARRRRRTAVPTSHTASVPLWQTARTAPLAAPLARDAATLVDGPCPFLVGVQTHVLEDAVAAGDADGADASRLDLDAVRRLALRAISAR